MPECEVIVVEGGASYERQENPSAEAQVATCPTI